MTVTLIQRGGDTQGIFIGPVPTNISEMLEAQNNSPLETERWELKEFETGHFLSEVEEFLRVKPY